jgi:hypothetical protein
MERLRIYEPKQISRASQIFGVSATTGERVMEKYLLRPRLGLIPVWKVSMPNRQTLECSLFKYGTEPHIKKLQILNWDVLE